MVMEVTAMSRTRIGVLCVGLMALVPGVARAQTEQVYYYHTDAVGSVRMITDASGQEVTRYDFWPFGQVSGSPAVQDSRMFAGQEHDGESQFDYLGARYYASQTGRFASPDPITENALRITNPQRWNRYAYAVESPLTYTDPDGMDALLINYSDGSLGLGHMGIMALNPNGSGLYGGFEPARKGSFSGDGIVNNVSFPPGSVQLGSDGRPTIASLAKLREWLAKVDGHSPAAIRIRHIKTSDAETAALAAYINQNIASPGKYNAAANNCQDFCIRGLQQAGIAVPSSKTVVGGIFPDVYYRSWLLDMASRLAEAPGPRVDTSYCFQGINCP
jgi:RHS repeat-associated protein